MKDAITQIINDYNLKGKYFDKEGIDYLKNYFETLTLRIEICKIINLNSALIINSSIKALYEEQPELIRPGGNSNTTRRYAACVRDLEYYLRYATYAMVAGDASILDERVLNGLVDTYNSLGVPIGPTVRSIQLLKENINTLLSSLKFDFIDFVEEPFDYLTYKLL
uniref:Allophycocyanin beta 18 subunit n=1 Tax=Cyanoptyche gloeocystis TaxID=77922 RepID=A0A3G1IW51_9EUKA|nr:allophycocyanin beta 18 subunit [Cyanoptyche gloeocystis]